MEDTLDDEEKYIKYCNDIVISALTYMDDIGRLAESKEDSQYANNKLEEMVNRKGLEFNIDKSNFVIIGSKKEVKRLQKDLEDEPLKLCNENIKQVKLLKYLVEFISS